jgi:hypothetical protein
MSGRIRLWLLGHRWSLVDGLSEVPGRISVISQATIDDPAVAFARLIAGSGAVWAFC